MDLPHIIAAFTDGDCDKTNKLMEELGASSTRIQKLTELKPGDQIYYPYAFGDRLYHHALVVRVIDDETIEIIELANPPDVNQGSSSSSSGSSSSGSGNTLVMVRKNKQNLSTLASDEKLYRVDYKKEKCLPPDEVIKRADGMLGQPGLHGKAYNIVYNNCEHFATWCKTNHAYSSQGCQIQE